MTAKEFEDLFPEKSPHWKYHHEYIYKGGASSIYYYTWDFNYKPKGTRKMRKTRRKKPEQSLLRVHIIK